MNGQELTAQELIAQYQHNQRLLESTAYPPDDPDAKQLAALVINASIQLSMMGYTLDERSGEWRPPQPPPAATLRQRGQRVYTEREHIETGEVQRRYGTVERDEIDGWDYTDVRFDDIPAFVQPIVSWYLFDDTTGGDHE